MSLKSVSKLFNPVPINIKTIQGNAGYDNARENIDPRIVTKSVLSQNLRVGAGVIREQEITNWNTAYGWGQSLKLDQTTPQSVINGVPYIVNGIKTPKIYPNADSTTAIQILKADGTTPIVTINTTDESVGIGVVPNDQYKFNIESTKTNANNRGLSSTIYSTVSAAAAIQVLGASYWVQEMYSSANNTGAVIGLYNNALTSRQSGSLTALDGMRNYYGTYSLFKGTVTHSRGMFIQLYKYGSTGAGTITNAYDIYIANPAGNATPATITNEWSIFSSHAAPSRISHELQIYVDNYGLKLGAASDASIYYDGTDLKINPKEVGTGILDVLGTIQGTGYQSSDGSAGITATITTAALTPGGSQGSMTFKNGILTAQTQAT